MLTSAWRTQLLRFVAAVIFVLAGINHFVHPTFYASIVPPMFPAPLALVAISGAAEIAGGLGLLVARLRRFAGWGLIALLIAVFPANIYMALAADRIEGLTLPPAILWLRLPLQAVFIAWVWRVAIAR